MGWFEMGSTIALIFECPKNYQIQRGEGESVKLGHSLLKKVEEQEQREEGPKEEAEEESKEEL